MKKATFKTLSILLAAAILVAALPVTTFAEDVSPCANIPCEHNYQVHYETSYSPVSEESHLIMIDEIETCTWCGESTFKGTDYDYEDHSFITSQNERYSYASNEYHYYIVEDINICTLCDGIYSEQQEVIEEYHEFDDSVDPEVDMQGVCIYCNKMIYW